MCVCVCVCKVQIKFTIFLYIHRCQTFNFYYFLNSSKKKKKWAFWYISGVNTFYFEPLPSGGIISTDISQTFLNKDVLVELIMYKYLYNKKN